MMRARAAAAAVAAAAVTLLLVIGAAPSVEAQLVGIDMGSMYHKVALVKPGSPFQIVTNVHSKRKTETLLGFDGPERRFGGEAATLATRRPKQTFAMVTRMLGRSAGHAAVKAVPGQYFPYAVSKDEKRGTAVMSTVGAGEHDVSLGAEEAMAHIFTHAKSNAENFLGGKVTDAVVAVPSYFTVAEREAMLDAADIAGFNVLSLIEENTAAALQYGIDRFFENETHTMLIFNMGASSTQVSVFEYDSYTLTKLGKNQSYGQFSVVGKAWDDALGGFDFDLKLVDFMADEFNKMPARKGKADVRENVRAMAKLRKHADKVKRVLSANKNYPITIESLADDIDFRSSITREQFETMAADLFSRVADPVARALEAANKTVEQIDQVEIIGGGVRVPKVQAILREMFSGKELGVHLNGDEAIALGAGFRAANMSKAFRVGRVKRSVGMIDTTYYPVSVKLENLPDQPAIEGSDEPAQPAEEWSRKHVLFKRKSHVAGKMKKMKMVHDQDFSVTLRYEDHTKAPLPEAVDPVFREFNITGLHAFAHGNKSHLGKPNVTLSFQVDNNGVPQLVKAEATLSEIIMPEPEPEAADATPVDVNATEEGDAKEAEDAKQADKDSTDADAADAADAAADADATADDGTNSTNAADDAAAASTPKKAKKPKKRTHRRRLKVTPVSSDTRTVHRLTKKQKSSAVKRLQEMAAADLMRKKKEELKNALESYVFATRSRIREHEEELSEVSTDEEREKIMEDLEGIEDWLYEDGADAELTEYKKKRSDMDKRVDAIFSRQKELELRPKAIAGARAVLEAAGRILELWPTERPQVSEEEIKEVKEVAESVAKWLDEKEKEQAEKENTDEPAFTSGQVSNKMQRLKNLVARLLKKKRPAPKEPEKATEEGDKKEEEGSSDGEKEKEGEGESKADDAGESADAEAEEGDAAKGGDDADASKAEL